MGKVIVCEHTEEDMDKQVRRVLSRAEHVLVLSASGQVGIDLAMHYARSVVRATLKENKSNEKHKQRDMVMLATSSTEIMEKFKRIIREEEARATAEEARAKAKPKKR